MGKREFLARIIQSTGLLPVLRSFTARHGNELRILAYHRVFDVHDESTFPFDPELISASTVDFCEQMEYVAAHFAPVTCADVLAATDGASSLPPRAIIVTFDDGHLDNYTNAFPVLRRLGIPATIFVSTAYIGAPGTFWFDQVANIIFRAPTGCYVVPGIKDLVQLSDVPSRRRASGDVLRHAKGLPNAQRLELIDWLAVSLKDKHPTDDTEWSGAMNWAQVREMAAAGIEFGSHSVSHPILTQLDDVSLDFELTKSREVIATEIGRPVNIIAYPVGGLHAFDARVISAAQRTGYRLGLSYISGTNQLSRLSLFSMQRLPVERYTSRARFRAMLEFPAAFK